MGVLKNRWWRGGAKEVSKNIGKRILWSSFNVARTSKQHIVYLSLALGIALIFFGQWITTISVAQKQKLIIPLRETDDAIDDVISGLNFLTQDLPVDVTEWLNRTIWGLQYDMQNLLNNGASSLALPLNHISGPISDAINEVIVWGKRKAMDSSNWTPVVIPTLTIPSPQIPQWAPALQLLDLSAARIPRREFSIEVELTPFIEKVFDVPLIVAYYLIAVGAALIAYGSARIGWALIVPWIPRIRKNPCVVCVKCMTATAKGMANVSQELMKPWIHIPLIVGILLTVAVALVLFATVDRVDVEVRGPLKKADDAILNVLYQVNNFTLDVPQEIKKFLDDFMDLAEDSSYLALTDAVSTLKSFLSGLFSSIANAINSAFQSIGVTDIVIPSQINEARWGSLIVIPRTFLPRIPLIDVSALLLPHSIAGIEKTLTPWIDDRIREFREVITVILIVAVLLIVLPGVVLLSVFIHPFIPHSVNEFFLRPDYEDADELPQQNQMELQTNE